MSLENQLTSYFGIKDVICKNLNTPTNDVIAVTTSTGRFALKLYTTRTAKEVQWELDLVDHLVENGAPVVKPIPGRNGFVESLVVDGQDRVAALFEWAAGEKPKAEQSTYVLLGKSAALTHAAADTFTPSLSREKYDLSTLIDEQLERMKTPLEESGQWQRVYDLTERLRKLIVDPALDQGVCHMDLTLDNVHRDGDTLTVFDFDSSADCWRSIEPHGVLRFSKDYFNAWLEGYRLVRPFSESDERAVAAFGIVGELRNVTWKLGLARSSRGAPLLHVPDLPAVVDEWLEWERNELA